MKPSLMLTFFILGTVPAFAIDANSLIGGTMNDWFNAKSNVTQQAASMMIARDRNAGITANALWSCLNEVAVGQNTGAQKVSEVAALCIVSMNGGR